MINQDFGDVPPFDDISTIVEAARKKKFPETFELPSDITVEGTLLGKNVAAPKTIDPSILVAVPRVAARKAHQISANLFTSGNDLWRAYECSTLTHTGMPVYFIAHIQYPSTSEFLVESKSLKLYLNSFNMDRQDSTITSQAIKEMMIRIQQDLSSLLKTDVRVWTDALTSMTVAEDTFKSYENLEKLVDYTQIENDSQMVDASLLKKTRIQEFKDVRFSFSGFRSNCKITNAPDYATVFIRVRGDTGVEPEGLVKYLTSYRNAQHLHEECCELIFSDLRAMYDPNQLFVTCCYTRRGGIDITPTRTFDVSESTGNKYLGGISFPETKYMYTPSRTIFQ